jgi:hypothetical protein
MKESLIQLQKLTGGSVFCPKLKDSLHFDIEA